MSCNYQIIYEQVYEDNAVDITYVAMLLKFKL